MDADSNADVLSWEGRLRIAIEAAQGKKIQSLIFRFLLV